jgi:hypothetical protein
MLPSSPGRPSSVAGDGKADKLKSPWLLIDIEVKSEQVLD